MITLEELKFVIVGITLGFLLTLGGIFIFVYSLIKKNDNKDKNPNKDIFNLDNFDELDQIKNYEYVMHGVIFHAGFEEGKSFIYASFGGLLMKYFGSSKHVCLESIKLDKRILLMIKKL